jgi:hypothetical protein
MAIGDVVPVAVKKDSVPFRRYCIAVILVIVVVKATLRKALPGDTVVMTGAADINGATTADASDVADIPRAASTVWSSTV